MWSWVAGIAALLLIAFIIFASWKNNSNTAAAVPHRLPRPAAPTRRAPRAPARHRRSRSPRHHRRAVRSNAPVSVDRWTTAMTDQDKRREALQRAAEYRQRAAQYDALSDDAKRRGNFELSSKFAIDALEERNEARKIADGVLVGK